MVRVEKFMTDEGIHDELDVYDPLIAGPGHLCASPRADDRRAGA